MQDTPYLTEDRHARWLAGWLTLEEADNPAQRRAALAALRLLRARMRPTGAGQGARAGAAQAPE